MRKFHLIQYSTNNLLNEEYLKISKQLCEKYSELHNYNYKFISINQLENIQQCWIKKLNIIYDELQNISENDFLVYIDTDIFINYPIFKLENFINDKYQIYIGIDGQWIGNISVLQQISNKLKKFTFKNSLYSFLIDKNNKIIKDNLFNDIKYIVQNPYGLNTGFIIIQKTQLMLQLLIDCINYAKIDWFAQQENDAYGDQNIISYFLLNKKYFSTFNLLPTKTQTNNIYSTHPLYGYFADTFLVHMYGENTEKRNKIANIILNKWKQENLIN